MSATRGSGPIAFQPPPAFLLGDKTTVIGDKPFPSDETKALDSAYPWLTPRHALVELLRVDTYVTVRTDRFENDCARTLANALPEHDTLGAHDVGNLLRQADTEGRTVKCTA